MSKIRRYKKSKPQEIPTFSNIGSKEDDQRTSDDAKRVCKICHKRFFDPILFEHHLNVHKIEKKIKCETCEISFENLRGLEKHKKRNGHIKKVCNLLNSNFFPIINSNL